MSEHNNPRPTDDERAGGPRDAAPKQARDAASPSGAAPGRSAGSETTGNQPSIESILRIPVVMQVVLGSATMPVANLMKLGRGQVVALDHRVGEPVDIVVNGRVIARGEVVVVDDDSSRFGVSLTEIVGPGIAADR